MTIVSLDGSGAQAKQLRTLRGIKLCPQQTCGLSPSQLASTVSRNYHFATFTNRHCWFEMKGPQGQD